MRWWLLELGIKLIQLNLKLMNETEMEWVVRNDGSFPQKRNKQREQEIQAVADILNKAYEEQYK